MNINEEQFKKSLEEYLNQALSEEQSQQPQQQQQQQQTIQQQPQQQQQDVDIYSMLHNDPLVVEDKVKFKLKYENDSFVKEYFDTIYLDALNRLARDVIVYGKPELKSFMDYMEIVRMEKMSKLNIVNKPVEEPMQQSQQQQSQQQKVYSMKDYYKDYIKMLELTTQQQEDIQHYHTERRDLPLSYKKGQLNNNLTKQELIHRLEEAMKN